MKALRILLFILLPFVFTSCNLEDQNSTKEKVTIKTLDKNKNLVDLEVNKNPERVAVLDMASLDIIDSLGEGDTVVASATVSIDYLMKYNPTKENKIINAGTVKEPNLEALYDASPEIIFIGGRMQELYDEISKVAPTVFISTDSTLGVFKSTSINAKEIAKIFDKEDKIDSLLEKYNADLNKVKDFANNENALVTMVNGNQATILNNSGRCSIIGVECGFNNIGNKSSSSTHGDSVSFEYFVKMNPKYIFVMDRNSVTGDTNNAKDVIENAIVKETDAYKNGNIIYLKNSNVWYVAEGGINALGVMLDDLIKGLGI